MQGKAMSATRNYGSSCPVSAGRGMDAPRSGRIQGNRARRHRIPNLRRTAVLSYCFCCRVEIVKAFDSELKRRLDALREQDLLRELHRVDSPQSVRIRIGGKTLLNFSSNDYLGLANDPALKAAAILAVERFGAGAGASRLVCGSIAPFHELEEALADFKGTEAALTFSTGYAAAVGTITALMGRDDIIILDKLVHACIVDGAKLSGAKLRVFAHNDLDSLEDKLQWARRVLDSPGTSRTAPRTLIVTESIFSMDGDRAPLKEIVTLKEKYGAWLMVDEAHATGVCGRKGRGIADELGISRRIEVQMGTLGKALGSSGGYICGSRKLIDYLVNRARSFVFSTAPVPAAAAAAKAALVFQHSAAGDARRNTLWERVHQLGRQLSFKILPTSAIIPVTVGKEADALSTASQIQKRGLFVPAIRYPTVARGTARLRVTLTANHSRDDVQTLTEALRILHQASPTT